jgi:hypothetical protein
MFACQPCRGSAILLTLLFSTQSESTPLGLAPVVCLFRPKEQEIPMKSIRNFAYAAVLTLSALNFAPSLASAQDAAGTFTLNHEVHWQNAVVPAGTYHFAIGGGGAFETLTLRKMSGDGAGFMLLVADEDASRPSEASQLVLVSRPGGSFVSALQLPEFGMTLRFTVPAATREVTQSVATTTASAAR